LTQNQERETMLANVTCPACQHKFWLQEGDMGSRQICPNCTSPFFAGKSVAEPRPSAALAGAVQPGYAKTMLGDSAPPIKYTCPRCKAPLEAAASEAGTKLNCPKCSQRVQVPAAPKPEPAAAAPGLNKTMLASDESAAPRPPIKYNCPNCKKPLEAPADQGGTKRNCPACNQRLQIPPAPPWPANRNKTMLASDASAGSVNVVQGNGAAPGTAAPVAPDPWARLLTPRNVVIGVIIFLLLAYVVPAIFRNGKAVDTDAAAKLQLDLEKLRQEFELKKMEMDRQAKAEAEARRQYEERMQIARTEEERRREDERRRLRDLDDDARRAEEKKQKQAQQEREKAAVEEEKKWQQRLADLQHQVDDNKRAMEAAQQKQQTIVAQPPPVVYYPPYSPRYWSPWWY
jgi:DNA-directed RNA polymerase subunit RPC12/RpoP